jgi:hypothetical protein
MVPFKISCTGESTNIHNIFQRYIAFRMVSSHGLWVSADTISLFKGRSRFIILHCRQYILLLGNVAENLWMTSRKHLAIDLHTASRMLGIKATLNISCLRDERYVCNAAVGSSPATNESEERNVSSLMLLFLPPFEERPLSFRFCPKFMTYTNTTST